MPRRKCGTRRSRWCTPGRRSCCTHAAGAGGEAGPGRSGARQCGARGCTARQQHPALLRGRREQRRPRPPPRSTRLVLGAVPAVLHENAIDVKQQQRAVVQPLLALAGEVEDGHLQQRREGRGKRGTTPAGWRQAGGGERRRWLRMNMHARCRPALTFMGSGSVARRPRLGGGASGCASALCSTLPSCRPPCPLLSESLPLSTAKASLADSLLRSSSAAMSLVSPRASAQRRPELSIARQQ